MKRQNISKEAADLILKAVGEHLDFLYESGADFDRRKVEFERWLNVHGNLITLWVIHHPAYAQV